MPAHSLQTADSRQPDSQTTDKQTNRQHVLLVAGDTPSASRYGGSGQQARASPRSSREERSAVQRRVAAACGGEDNRLWLVTGHRRVLATAERLSLAIHRCRGSARRQVLYQCNRRVGFRAAGVGGTVRLHTNNATPRLCVFTSKCPSPLLHRSSPMLLRLRSRPSPPRSR